MAYQDYLIKVGEYIIPTKYMKPGTYSTSLTVQDLDSFRDMQGKLHRTALAHKVNKVEFETPKMMTNAEMTEFLENLRNNYIVANERKLSASIYVPEIDAYMEQEVYLVDPKFTIYNQLAGVIYYNPVRIAFIAY
ncbi:MAG: hypothetical protein IJ379_05230 [Lachnospiraceae bacterium]|nr:hypothetical protein [Lachnospiraceae bacterium]